MIPVITLEEAQTMVANDKTLRIDGEFVVNEKGYAVAQIDRTSAVRKDGKRFYMNRAQRRHPEKYPGWFDTK